MNQQRKLPKYNNRQSSFGETASVGSTKSARSNYSNEYSSSSLSNNTNQQSAKKSNGLTRSHGSQESTDSGGNGLQSAPATILNVAEMLLHGVADNEILDIWLRSINCEDFVANFINAGYDMPTISRITPQDLTAVGITDPSKRLKILSEIKKLNLQDGLPKFRPASLSHWLSLIRLDSYYYKSLCDQQIDTIEKMCQLTWEDFEELGINKLGHQKRLQLAIERLKSLEDDTKNASTKTLSEPIYDTNPRQILLVASTENHSMNGPIINKQASTSEVSSTGSGSMHSLYSSNSNHYQPSYSQASEINQTNIMNQMTNGTHEHINNQSPIYNQTQPQIIYQQPSQMIQNNQSLQHQSQQSIYQTLRQQQSSQQPIKNVPLQYNGASMQPPPNMLSSIGPINTQQNRQSMSQIPFNIAKLPLHQQQQLQQSSIYATLSRQPGKIKQPPPPVPVRTNSLKTNSLVDEPNGQTNHYNHQQQLHNSHTTSTYSLSRSGVDSTPTHNRSHFESQTLTKNKSFSGNAHMEMSRARFLNRNSQQIQHYDQNLYSCKQNNNAFMNNLSHQQQMASDNLKDTPLNSTTASSCTLNDASLISDLQNMMKNETSPIYMATNNGLRTPTNSTDCNATTGKDDDFPPPPSPLSMTDSDEHDLVSINSDNNFTDLQHGLMTFRVEI